MRRAERRRALSRRRSNRAPFDCLSGCSNRGPIYLRDRALVAKCDHDSVACGSRGLTELKHQRHGCACTDGAAHPTLPAGANGCRWMIVRMIPNGVPAQFNHIQSVVWIVRPFEIDGRDCDVF